MTYYSYTFIRKYNTKAKFINYYTKNGNVIKFIEKINLMKKVVNIIFIAFSLTIILSACTQLSSFSDFTTYFNTYYNANRLMNEAEDEFGYFDEKLRITPRVIVPTPEIFNPNFVPNGPPPFMDEFIIKQFKRQPVVVKLDSIIIKGSKILSTSPKGEYVQKSLFLMAKTYFYREEWLNSQVKCGELIDIYPDGDMSPDAHLLYSKTLLIERKFIQGKMMLSRTVDIAWYKKRYDILSEAFRLQAEQSLYEKNLEGALRPYYQAITQTSDNEMKAKWQLDLAALLYRLGYFEKAESEFAKVLNYKPDYLGKFESKLYRAASLNRLKKFDLANDILDDIENDGKFTEWKGFTYAERLQSMRIKSNLDSSSNKKKLISELDSAEKFADTAYIGNNLIQCYYFDRGMDYYQNNEYNKAAKYFVRVQGAKTPVSNTARDLFKAITELEERYVWIAPTMNKIEEGAMPNDTVAYQTSSYLFEMSRTHELLKNKDSAVYYSKLSYEISPKSNQKSARFLYAYSRLIKATDPLLSDSLYEVLANNYMGTEYGDEAARVLGFTKEFKIDPVEELFTSGSSNRINGNFEYANKQFLKIYNEYPNNPLAPKSLYTIGWTFENHIKDKDSTFYYYNLLIQKYPTSIYALDIKSSTEFYAVVQANGGEVPDSLKLTKKEIDKINIDDTAKRYEEIRKELEIKNAAQKEQNEKSGFDDFLDPTKLFEQTKKMLNDQLNTIQSAPDSLLNSLPKLPSLDSLGSLSIPTFTPNGGGSSNKPPDNGNGESGANSDSTKTKQPIIIEPKKK